jgi:hypothetical protein
MDKLKDRSLSQEETLNCFEYKDGWLFWKRKSEANLSCKNKARAYIIRRKTLRRAGTVDHLGYVRILINGRAHKAHRLIWIYHYGSIPKDRRIDHIDGKRNNNLISNLRLATQSENLRNRGANSNNTSGYKGVSFDAERGKWKARIVKNGKETFIGRFQTAQEAHDAYISYGSEIHGEFFNAGEPA